MENKSPDNSAKMRVLSRSPLQPSQSPSPNNRATRLWVPTSMAMRLLPNTQTTNQARPAAARASTPILPSMAVSTA